MNAPAFSELAETPQWLLDTAGKRRIASTETAVPVAPLDEPAAISRAIEWLTGRAPQAIEGAGGNSTTYSVAARVKDFGVSEATALNLLVQHWNEAKAVPMWDYEELQQVVANAYRYGTSPAGSASALAEFSVVELRGAAENGNASAAPWPVATPLADSDPATIPEVAWIVPKLLARRFAAALIGTGGTGKGRLVTILSTAIATGDASILGLPILEAAKVWYWNQEDDSDELARRFAAVRKKHEISWPALLDTGDRPKLFVDSGVNRPLMIVKRGPDRRLHMTKEVDRIIEEIRARDVGVFIVDPLSEIHEANENDNSEMRFVWSVLRRIAVRANCAVLGVAHSRKPPQASADGFAGDPNVLRGAASQIDLVRIAHTLFAMSAKDARTWGVPESDRHLYIRLDDAKANLALKSSVPLWFKLVSVRLREDSKSTVGVLEPAALNQRATVDVLHTVAKTIAAGNGLRRNQVHSLSEVIEKMTANESAAFGVPSQYARAVKKAMTVHGHKPSENDKEPSPFNTLTDYGCLDIYVQRGKRGVQFKLGADPNSTMGAAAMSNWLEP